ncbi:hypothetical protein HRG_000240 [Hirsutella rhossiliensis]|uniref:Uncharacterized protein n=1 Tax=Hirsutella rhossiliensis TaxID=111463 RepID=A0A9P8N3F1_9HYPO|nr:uncharacterized protein HRG_00240 [Hirsutella rhossiliensis]KAH0967598.1 hypothetical protein HRG_00240 [Hirsutella rhossiliensis]
MTVRVNGFRFAITVSPDCFVNFPRALELFGQIFDKITAGEDEDPEVWTYGEHVADVFVPAFTRPAPPMPHTTGKLTLADLGVRDSFKCEYWVLDEKPVAGAVTQHVLEDIPPPEEWDMRSLQSCFSIFDPADTDVPYSDGSCIHDIIPRQVFVKDKAFFYQTCWSPYDALDEVEKYARIHASGLSTQMIMPSSI